MSIWSISPQKTIYSRSYNYLLLKKLQKYRRFKVFSFTLLFLLFWEKGHTLLHYSTFRACRRICPKIFLNTHTFTTQFNWINNSMNSIETKFVNQVITERSNSSSETITKNRTAFGNLQIIYRYKYGIKRGRAKWMHWFYIFRNLGKQPVYLTARSI